MILILSNKFDISADYVIRLLRKRDIEYLRLNTEDLINLSASIHFPNLSYEIKRENSEWNLARTRSIWFRRPGKPFEFTPRDKRPPSSTLTFIENQWHTFIEGLKGFDNIFWVNHPDNNHLGENKILQLDLAQKLGLKIPRTCITNNKDEALGFQKLCDGKIVSKALSLPLIEEEDTDFFIFTNVIESLENASQLEFNLAPTIFQELLDDKIDYRLTIVGDDHFSVRVIRESNKKESVDWRVVKKGIKFVPTELPKDIIDKCIQLVKKFNLVFGAIDIVQANDDFYFLEINPNGEWAWLQKEAKLPIAESLVNVLSNGEWI